MTSFKVELRMPDGVKHFECPDDEYVLEAAEQAGIKPVQFVRSTVLRTLNGHLVDAKSIDAYLKQQEKEEFHKRRGH